MLRTISNKNICATSGAGTAHLSGTPEFTPGFKWGSLNSIFSCMCMFFTSLFVLLYLVVVLRKVGT